MSALRPYETLAELDKAIRVTRDKMLGGSWPADPGPESSLVPERIFETARQAMKDRATLRQVYDIACGGENTPSDSAAVCKIGLIVEYVDEENCPKEPISQEASR